jgi:hypothetical protein
MLRFAFAGGLVAAQALLLSACGSAPTQEEAAVAQARDEKVCVTGSNVCRRSSASATGVKSISPEAARAAMDAAGPGPSH